MVGSCRTAAAAAAPSPSRDAPVADMPTWLVVKEPRTDSTRFAVLLVPMDKKGAEDMATLKSDRFIIKMRDPGLAYARKSGTYGSLTKEPAAM